MCGKPTVVGTSNCTECKIRKAKNLAVKRKKRRLLGLCTVCGCQPEPGYTKCLICKEKHNKFNREVRRLRVLAGLCSECDAPQVLGRTKCAKCAEIARLIMETLHQTRKTIILNHYGAMCACCGISDKEFLTLDHINNDASEYRKSKIHGGGTHSYKYVIDNDFPEDFQILCWNCNCAKGAYGMCPHERRRREFQAMVDILRWEDEGGA